MWFGALFGMGSLALRAQTLESAVRALHIDLVVPAAAPPLGFTARLLVAVVFALGGAAVGFVLARLVAARTSRNGARPTAARPARPGKPTRAQRNAATEAADDNDDLARLDAAREAAPVRRRGVGGLTATAPEATPGEDPYAALPGALGGPSILNLGDLDAVEPLAPAPGSEPAAAEAPAGFWADLEPSPEAAPAATPGTLRTVSDATGDSVDLEETAGLYGVSPFGPTALAAALAPSVPTPAPGMTGFPAAPLAGPESRSGEPASVAPGPAASAPAESPPAESPLVEPVTEPATAGSGHPEPLRSRRLVPRAGSAEQLLREARLESLGVVELVERFAMALAARSAHEAAQPMSAAGSAVAPQRNEEPIESMQAPQHAAPAPQHAAPAPLPRAVIARAPAPEAASPPPFAAPAQPAPARPFDVPSMLRSPLPGGNVEWFEDGAAEDYSLTSLLPPRMAPALTDAAPLHADPALAATNASDFGDGPDLVVGCGSHDDDEDAMDGAIGSAIDPSVDRFSSLLDMKPSTRPRPAEVAPIPVRLPGASLPNEPDVTEDALRSALAALQRMSGAA